MLVDQGNRKQGVIKRWLEPWGNAGVSKSDLAVGSELRKGHSERHFTGKIRTW